jgi:spermidine synthase
MRELGVRPEERKAFMRAWAATSLGMEAELAGMRGREAEAERFSRLAWRANPKDRWAGFALADRMFASLAQARALGIGRERALRRILAIRPDHVRALKALLHLKIEQGRKDEAERLRRRILRLSPLDADMRRMTRERNRRMLGEPL